MVIFMYLLESGRLRAAVDSGGERYLGTRFDRGGIVTDLWFDGHSFCGIEDARPFEGSGGIGLCSEFGIDGVESYDDFPMGEAFLKIGVGWLQKDREKYNFMATYPMAHAVEEQVEISGDKTSVCFHFDSGVRDGVGVVRDKAVQLEGEELVLSMTLRNIGEKPLVTAEYCHNFLQLDGMQVDGRYRFSSESGIDGKVNSLLSGEEPVYYTRLDGGEVPASFRSWEIEQGGISIRESCSFPLCRFAFWGTRTVLSPECFIRLELAPEQEMSWQRRYSFSVK